MFNYNERNVILKSEHVALVWLQDYKTTAVAGRKIKHLTAESWIKHCSVKQLCEDSEAPRNERAFNRRNCDSAVVEQYNTRAVVAVGAGVTVKQ